MASSLMPLVLSMPTLSCGMSALTLVRVVTMEVSSRHSDSHLPHHPIGILNFDIVLFNSSLLFELLTMFRWKLLKTLLFKLSLDRVSVVNFLSSS